MKIDGVSAEPSQGDNPFAMGPVALDIDCDLDVLAHKVGTGGSKTLGIWVGVERSRSYVYEYFKTSYMSSQKIILINCLHEFF